MVIQLQHIYHNTSIDPASGNYFSSRPGGLPERGFPREGEVLEPMTSYIDFDFYYYAVKGSIINIQMNDDDQQD